MFAHQVRSRHKIERVRPYTLGNSTARGSKWVSWMPFHMFCAPFETGKIVSIEISACPAVEGLVLWNYMTILDEV